MSTHIGIFPFSNPVFNRFLRWGRQGDEDENWKQKVLATLEKKLKKKKDGSYEAFFNEALILNSPNTPCVTLDRSQDGRLQVSHRKMLPHVMACRIVRWPDLQTHQELKSVDHCRFPGHQKLQKQVCINPYHYVRVDHPIYPSPFSPEASGSFSYSPSISPQAPPHVVSPGLPVAPNSARSFESQTPPPGYRPVEMDVDNKYHFQVSNSPNNIVNTIGTNNMGENPFSRNSNIWCKITYWELSSRVGEPFTASSPSVTIDGYIDPTNHYERFSLGSLSNINRNSVIETTRRAIGSGVLLWKTGTDVYAKNLSELPVFVQSRNFNVASDFRDDKGNTRIDMVIRIPANCQLKIFDFNVFEELVKGAVRSQENNYERVLSLNSHCSIKMSFVKGWGERYTRQEVTSAPCWLEITLYEPLAYLDTKLQELGSPKCPITSTS